MKETDGELELIKSLGLIPTSGIERVLNAILSSQESLGRGVTIDAIDKKLSEMAGGKKTTRPLIYRHLKALEQSGLMTVNRTNKPYLYTVNFESTIKAIERYKTEKLLKLQQEIDRIDVEQEMLKSVEMPWLARRFVERLVGPERKVRTKTVKGVSNALLFIENEISYNTTKGDVLRVTTDWIPVEVKEQLESQYKRMVAAMQGAKIRVMEYHPRQVLPDIVAWRYKALQELVEEGTDIEYKIANQSRQGVRTYQGIALNRDSLILLVSEEPFILVWIPRETNAALIDEAVNSFDRDFEQGIDYLEYYKEGFDEL